MHAARVLKVPVTQDGAWSVCSQTINQMHGLHDMDLAWERSQLLQGCGLVGSSARHVHLGHAGLFTGRKLEICAF